MFGINQLGAAAGSVSPGGNAEWNAYFAALKSTSAAKWQKALDSYNTLKSVRQTLGLPFIVDQGTGEGGPGASAGAWTSDLEQQAVQVKAMGVLVQGALQDVIDNKRRVAPTQEGDGWAIEALPSDVLRLEVKPPGVPTLVNAQTGAPQNVQGTVGAIWIPLLAAGAIVTMGGIYLHIRAMDALVSIAQEKTAQTIALRNADLIKSGKATPEQASALTSAEGKAAADLAKARAEEKKSGGIDPEKWSPLVKTIVWGGVAIGALVIVAKLLPSGGGATRAANPSRATNPMWGGKWVSPFDREAPPATRGARKYHLTRVYLNRGGYTSSGRYFGIGKPLYEYSSTDGEVHGYLRASSRAEAKQHLRSEQGGALFFNPLGMRAINALSPMMLSTLA